MKRQSIGISKRLVLVFVFCMSLLLGSGALGRSATRVPDPVDGGASLSIERIDDPRCLDADCVDPSDW